MKTKLPLLFLLFITSFSAHTQVVGMGAGYSLYGGVFNTQLTPSVAGSAEKLDISLGNVSFNQLSGSYPLTLDSSSPSSFNGTDYFIPQDISRWFIKTPVQFQNALNYLANTDVLLPGSFVMKLDKNRENRNTIGFTYGYHANVFLYNGSNDFYSPLLWNDAADSTISSHSVENFKAGGVSWMDFGLTYSRVLRDRGRHMVAAGVTVKALQGMCARYVSGDYIGTTALDKGAINLSWNNVDYFQSVNAQSQDATQFGIPFNNSWTGGFDLGFTYEFRKSLDQFEYQMDDSTFLDHGKRKHWLLFGASIMDIGRVNFDLNSKVKSGNITSGDFSFLSGNEYNQFSNQALDDSIAFGRAYVQELSSFNFKLPTRINLIADFNAYKGLGVGFFGQLPLSKLTTNSPSAFVQQCFVITPKFETPKFGIYLPFSFPEFGSSHLGLSLRLGPFAIGTSNLDRWMINKGTDFYQQDLHVSFRIPINYNRQGDMDHDGYSDLVDKCKENRGVRSAKGCPDLDGDGISDFEDECKLLAGPKSMKGCPDEDGDGIKDDDDACPMCFGPIDGTPKPGCPDEDHDGFIECDDKDKCPGIAGEFQGCPDQDGDGVYDFEDKCPTKKGNVEGGKFGCPDTDGDGLVDDVEDTCNELIGPTSNSGCPTTDLDSDEVYDYEDYCPEKPGPRSNNGCPVSTVNRIEASMDIFYFEEADLISKAEEPRVRALTEIVLSLLEMDSTTKVILRGHTDVNEPAELQIPLGYKRAQRIKELMIQSGVPENKIEVVSEGAEKNHQKVGPTAGKYLDRRVEAFTISE